MTQQSLVIVRVPLCRGCLHGPYIKNKKQGVRLNELRIARRFCSC